MAETAMRGVPPLFRGERRRLLLRLIANGIAQGAAAGMFALGLRGLLDEAQPAQAAGQGLLLPLLAVLVAGALRRQERIDAERLGQSYVNRVRLQVFDHLARVAPARLHALRHGAVALRFVGDMSALRAWASRGVARVWVAGATAGGVLAVLAWLDVRFALAVAAVLAIAGVAAHREARALDAAVRHARRRRGRFAAGLQEQLQRLPMIQAYARRDAEKALVAERARRLRNASVVAAARSGRIIAIVTVATGLASLAIAAIGRTGGQGGAAHSHGTLLAALLLVSLLAAPLHRLGRVFELWRAARVAREQLDRLLYLPAMPAAIDAAPLPKGRGAIAFAGVALPGRFGPFDGRVRAGERVRLDGDEAAALLWALPRLREDVIGTIRIDGQPIDTIAPGALRRAVVLVSEALPLVRGTLGENLRYRMPSASPEALDHAIERCGLRDTVARLPQGLDTPLGDAGLALGAAERWRVRWVRALLGRPRILLFEDVGAQLRGGNRDAFAAMLAGFRGTVLMTGAGDDELPADLGVRRLSIAASTPPTDVAPPRDDAPFRRHGT